jgi:hypothetical protein
MISARKMAILAFWAALSASLMGAQELKPLDTKVMQQRLDSIQEPGWELPRVGGASLFWAVPPTPLMDAQDLSRYRDFQFGMTLLEIAKQTGLEPSAATMIHRRPAVIQELEWRPRSSPSASPQADPVKEIFFSFYNGELYRMVVHYDRYKTEGLTVGDMVDALSAKYGKAAGPAAGSTVSLSQGYNDTEEILASWGDLQYSFNLFHSSYMPVFGMIAFSKKLDSLARVAIAESIRLDEQEAPQREIDRQKKQAGEALVAQEKARGVNKPNFRP